MIILMMIMMMVIHSFIGTSRRERTVIMPLVGFPLPTLSCASHYSVQKPSFDTLLQGLTVGCLGGRCTRANSPLPRTNAGRRRADALTLYLEPLLEVVFQPGHILDRAHGRKIIAVQECAETPAFVEVQAGVSPV